MLMLIVAINVKVSNAVANRVGTGMVLARVATKTNATSITAIAGQILCALTSVIHIVVSAKLASQ